MEFKDRIRVLRRENNMTQSELATMLNKSEGAVRAWEIDKSRPDIDTLVILAKYFNCTTDYLLGISEYKNEKERDDIEVLSISLNEVISKMKNGKALLESLVGFLDFFDMESYPEAAFNFLKAADLLLSQFREMQKIHDKIIETKSFDLLAYVDLITNLSTSSAGANRLMHIISTIPIKSILEQTQEFASPNDISLALKIYNAYYERFIYEIPTINPYNID